MDITMEDVLTLLTMGVGVVGMYTSYVSKIKMMEADLEDLKSMVNELRLDIKELLQK